MAKARRSRAKTGEKQLAIKPRRKGVFGAAIYVRVSTASQTHDSQLKALHDYCEAREWDVLVEVQDVASGASRRPNRELLVQAAKQKRVDGIVVFKLDRWGRSTPDVIATLQELDACGCTFVSVSDAIDMSTPAGRALTGMLAVFAGFERDLIRERVNAGLDAARANGVQFGRPATASSRADAVRALRAEGLSQRAIAERLGIGNGSVCRILRRELANGSEADFQHS